MEEDKNSREGRELNSLSKLGVGEPSLITSSQLRRFGDITDAEREHL